MKNTRFNTVTKIAFVALVSLGVLTFTGCEKPSEEPVKKDNGKTPPKAISELSSPEGPIKAGDPTVQVAEEATLASDGANERMDGAATYIHFGDKTACQWNPDICNNSFVVWPGYIQSTSAGEYGYAWMSGGPGANFIGPGTSAHYHIMGLFMPAEEPNPKHTSMFGSDWFAFYMQRVNSGRINFDLTQIYNTGTVPIQLWFKKADNTWRYWASLAPGRWNLPGATNIKEIHIRSASGASQDLYSIDDILIKGL